MASDHGLSFALGGYNMAQAHAAQQAGHLQGMANNTMAAIAKENDSRVAISREMRRMAHEQEMERMRQEAERQRNEAILARLNKESGGYMNPFDGFYIQ